MEAFQRQGIGFGIIGGSATLNDPITILRRGGIIIGFADRQIIRGKEFAANKDA